MSDMPPPDPGTGGSGTRPGASRRRRASVAFAAIGLVAVTACAPWAEPSVTAPPSPTTGPDLPATLQAVLQGEYAAEFAYGVAGGQLTSAADRTAAGRALADHERARDRLRTELTAAGVPPEPPAPAYALPSAVTSPAGARALASQVETRLVPHWDAAAHAAPPGSPAAAWALAAARACERRAASWQGQGPKSGQ